MRKKRAGENAKMIPLTVAPYGPTPSWRASSHAPSPHSTWLSSATRLRARTTLPVSQMIGAAMRPLPMMFSDHASVLS